MGSDTQTDLAAYIQFDSHDHANTSLQQIGYTQCHQTADFSPTELCDRVNELVKEDSLILMDITTAIPDTCHAAYQAVTVAGFTAAAACKKDTNAAFMVLRTEANTPSFLFGHHWGIAQAVGKKVADAQIRDSPTPALLIIFRDRQFQVPVSVCRAGLNITARLVAHELTTKQEFLQCCVCLGSFVKQESNACVSVHEMGVAPCMHFFHRECALKHLSSGYIASCPACGVAESAEK